MLKPLMNGTGRGVGVGLDTIIILINKGGFGLGAMCKKSLRRSRGLIRGRLLFAVGAKTILLLRSF